MAGPLDRTWYNTLVDDDGTNTVGSLWEKADVDSLMDAVDAALATVPTTPVSVANGGTGATTLTAKGVLYGDGTSPIGATAVGTAGQVLTSNGAGVAPTFQAAAGGGEPTEQTTTATGSQNDFSLSAAFTYLRCTGASPSFTGFSVAGSAPTAGDRVLIHCLGTTAHVAHANASSTDAYRVNTPSLAGQIIGVDGMMLLVYDDTTNRWRETLLDAGAWITPTYAGGDYTASSGTWTVDSGDVITMKYQQLGRALQVIFNLQTTSTSATPFALRFNVFGFTLTSALAGSFVYFEGGNWGVGTLIVSAAATTVTLAKDGGGVATWTTETNAKMVEGSCVLEIN